MALTAVFLHSGQVCSAGARLLVEESIHDDFVDELVARAGRIRLGGPFDDDGRDRRPDLRAHRDKVAAYVDAGVAEGAVLRVRRRARRPTASSPTASTTCRPCSTAARTDMSVRRRTSPSARC